MSWTSIFGYCLEGALLVDRANFEDKQGPIGVVSTGVPNTNNSLRDSARLTREHIPSLSGDRLMA